MCFSDFNILNILFFSIPIGILFGMLCHLFKKEIINKILFIVLVAILTIVYVAQLVYFFIYDSFFSLSALFMAGQVTEAADQVLTVIQAHIGHILLLFIPLVLSGLLLKFGNFQKISVLHKNILMACFLIVHGLCLMSVNFDRGRVNYNYDIYSYTTAPVTSVSRFGVLTALRLDVEKSILKVDESDLLVSSNQAPTYEENNEVTYNQLDIDWETIIANEDNKDLKQIHQYFSNQTATNQNDYTGIFEGKNVVFVLAESLYAPAISEELTPTLYKMKQEGFQFNNYYVPLFPTSTADGEYMLEWSLLPIIGNAYNLINSSKNLNAYGFVNTFSNLGYKVSAYHGFAGYYYNRETYFKRQGFDEYGFCDTTLNMKCTHFHASDLKMVQNSIQNYINEDSFFTYYVSISGHGGYDYEDNFIVRQNWNEVKDLDYSDLVKGYLAGTLELERAMAYLVESFEKAGKLDDTVFVISPDHWPYYFKTILDELETLAGDSIYDKFDVHKNALIIYNSAMEEPVTVNKTVASIDVLPTLLNLMGVDYDSRLLMGTDALSSNDSVAIFSDYSWITDLGRYDGKEFVPSNSNITIPENYIENMNTIVKQKILVSSLIQKKNYYQSLFEKIETSNDNETISNEGDNT